MLKILIDGDILVYQIGWSVQSYVYVADNCVYKRKEYAKTRCRDKGLDPETSIFKRRNIESFQQVRINLKAKLNMFFEDLETNKFEMFLTDTGVEKNYRNSTATLLPYKGNRAKTEKPYYYKQIRALLQQEYGAELVTGQEADDMLGIRQAEIFKANGNYENSIIASIDKDLLTIPGQHYHMNNRIIQWVEPDDALKNFYGQLLKGDYTDNIPGLSKLLEIKGREEESNKLSYSHYLKKYEEFRPEHTPEECYNYVLEQYQKYDLLEYVKEIGQLLWIRQDRDQMWEPEHEKKN